MSKTSSKMPPAFVQGSFDHQVPNKPHLYYRLDEDGVKCLFIGWVRRTGHESTEEFMKSYVRSLDRGDGYTMRYYYWNKNGQRVTNFAAVAYWAPAVAVPTDPTQPKMKKILEKLYEEAFPGNFKHLAPPRPKRKRRGPTGSADTSSGEERKRTKKRPDGDRALPPPSSSHHSRPVKPVPATTNERASEEVNIAASDTNRDTANKALNELLNEKNMPERRAKQLADIVFRKYLGLKHAPSYEHIESMRRYVRITGPGSGIGPSAGYQLYLREVLPPDEERDAPPKIRTPDDGDCFINQLVMLVRNMRNPSSRTNRSRSPPEIPEQFKERHSAIDFVLKHG